MSNRLPRWIGHFVEYHVVIIDILHETTIMRIVRLRAVSSPRHIEWDTFSHFLPSDIWNLTHLIMLIMNLFPFPSIIQHSLESPASRIEGILVKAQMVCSMRLKKSNPSLSTNTLHVLTYFHGHRQFWF